MAIFHIIKFCLASTDSHFYSTLGSRKKILLFFISKTTLIDHRSIVTRYPTSVNFCNIPIKVRLDIFSKYIFIIMIIIWCRYMK